MSPLLDLGNRYPQHLRLQPLKGVLILKRARDKKARDKKKEVKNWQDLASEKAR